MAHPRFLSENGMRMIVKGTGARYSAEIGPDFRSPRGGRGGRSKSVAIPINWIQFSTMKSEILVPGNLFPFLPEGPLAVWRVPFANHLNRHRALGRAQVRARPGKPSLCRKIGLTGKEPGGFNAGTPNKIENTADIRALGGTPSCDRHRGRTATDHNRTSPDCFALDFHGMREV